MERKNITLSKLCVKKLKEMGKLTGLSASELIRNAVDVYYNQIILKKVTVVSRKVIEQPKRNA